MQPDEFRLSRMGQPWQDILTATGENLHALFHRSQTWQTLAWYMSDGDGTSPDREWYGQGSSDGALGTSRTSGGTSSPSIGPSEMETLRLLWQELGVQTGELVGFPGSISSHPLQKLLSVGDGNTNFGPPKGGGLAHLCNFDHWILLGRDAGDRTLARTDPPPGGAGRDVSLSVLRTASHWI